MLNFTLRPAELDDLSGCLALDGGYITNYVWQMEEQVGSFDSFGVAGTNETRPRPKILGKSSSPTPDEYRIAFRPSRLPRPLAVPSPFNEQDLLNNWKKTDYLLVAENIPGEADLGHHESQATNAGNPLEPDFPVARIIGYIGLQVDSMRHVAWLSSYVVQPNFRRKGVGQSLYREARAWAERHRLRALMVELETKNYPALQFFQQQGFFFCGYNSAYYANRQLALFFGCKLPTFE